MTSEQSPNSPPPAEPGVRLFFCVQPDAEMREAMADLSSRLQKAARFTPLRATWMEPDAFHVTLHFLGEVPESAAKALVKRLPLAVAKIPPFELDFRHVGYFPKVGPPTVVWLGVHKAPPHLEALRQAVGGLARSVGADIGEKDFTPHVTYARLKSAKGTNVFAKMLETYKFAKLDKCPIAEVTLMQSITGNGPASYKTYATAPLTGAGKDEPDAAEGTPD